MGVTAAVLATAIVLLLVFVQPIRGKRRYERLVQAVAEDPGARVGFYRRGILAQWIMVGLVSIVGLLASRAGHHLALGPGTDPGKAWGNVAELVVVIAVTTLVFRSRSEAIRTALRRQLGGFRALLPLTTVERLWFVGVSLTAGICEEIVFRGFGLLYVRWAWSGVSDGLAILLVSIVFGLAHVYQGPRGVILTGIVGGLLGWLTFTAGGLVPAMIVHALIDLRVAALPDLGEPPDPTTSPPGPFLDAMRHDP